RLAPCALRLAPCAFVRCRTDLPPSCIQPPWHVAPAVRWPTSRRLFMKKFLIALLSLLAVSLAVPLQAAPKGAPKGDKSLYERLGGVFAIAAVVDQFSDALVQNPVVGKTSQNPALREWHTNNLDRLPGLKFMRTLWVCEVTGGPFKFSPTKPGKTHLALEVAHRDLKISPAEFDEVAA